MRKIRQNLRQGGCSIFPRDKIFLSDGGSVENIINIYKENPCNLEVMTFAFPDNLSDDITASAKDYLSKFNNSDYGRISIHGPFFDITLTTPDSDLVEHCKKRYRQGLEVAKAMKAEKIVFHTQLNVQLRFKHYHERWLYDTSGFISSLLEDEAYSDIYILIENMFDEKPDDLCLLMEKISSARAGVCLDVAHIAVYGGGDYDRWIKTLAPYIKHVHLSDNDGHIDRHWALGKGIVDFERIFKSLNSAGIKPDLCLEMNSESDHRQSLEYLDNLWKSGCYYCEEIAR